MFNLTFSFPLTKNKPHSWDDFSMKQHGRLPRAGSSVLGVRRGERAWPAGPPTQDAKPDSGGQRAAPRPEGPGHQHHARVFTCAHTQPPPRCTRVHDPLPSLTCRAPTREEAASLEAGSSVIRDDPGPGRWQRAEIPRSRFTQVT